MASPLPDGAQLSLSRQPGARALRVLEPSDRPAAEALLAADPVANVFVTSRVHASGLDPWRLGGEMWGWSVDGELRALCYSGANLVPVAAEGEAVLAFAERARRQGRRCSSLVGPADQVLGLWDLLEPSWGRAREVRAEQPLLATTAEAAVDPDPAVRPVRPDELDVVLPACVAMFTEEVGISPLAGDGGVAYRTRVAELVASGRAFARIEDGRVVFKAEIGAVTESACQVQGVWVDPERRGQGLAVPGMAAVVAACLRDVAPLVSLYVNDFNEPALATYRKVGFDRVGTFATVLF